MTLEKLIASNPDPREVKRALAVRMRIQGLKHREIQPILGIHSGYIKGRGLRPMIFGSSHSLRAYPPKDKYLEQYPLREKLPSKFILISS